MTDGAGDHAPARSRARRLRGRLDEVRPRVADAATRHRWLATTLVVLRRDLEIGGTLLAGALAFRLFVWLLPCTLLIAALLGFTASGGHSVGDLARENGLGPLTASYLDQVAGQAERGRYVTGLLGLLLLFVAGTSLGRALDRIHTRVWHDHLEAGIRPTLARAARYTTALMLIVAGNLSAPLLAAAANVSVLFLEIPMLAVITTLITILFTGDWPPHWRRHLPGAALVALGAAALHLVSVLYLPHKLARASDLYGALGVAATMLVWLAIIARLLVLGQVLNASRAEPDDPKSGGPTTPP